MADFNVRVDSIKVYIGIKSDGEHTGNRNRKRLIDPVLYNMKFMTPSPMSNHK